MGDLLGRRPEGRARKAGRLRYRHPRHHRTQRAEEALRAGEERLRLIVESARDYAIFTTDPQDRIVDWAPGAAAVFGWSAEEATGRPSAVLFTPEDRETGVPEREAEAARREGAAPNVRWHVRKDGARVFIEGSVTALREADGSVRGFLKIGQDVTERRRAEEALLASEARLRELQAELLHVSRVSAAGEMAAALAHELNQPLTAAASAVQAARRTLAAASAKGLGEQPPEVREAMDLAAEQARRAGQIVRRLRDFVARGVSEKRLESVPRLIEEAAALALVGARERGVAVALRVEPGIAPGARRPDPDRAGAVQPDAERPRGDGR